MPINQILSSLVSILLTLQGSVSSLPSQSQLAQVAQTNISFLSEAHIDNAGVTSLNVPININSGETVVVVATMHTSSRSVSSVSDTGGSSYSRVTSANNGSKVEVWAALSASSASSVTVNFDGTLNGGVAVLRYSGVSQLGNTNTSSGSQTSPRSLSLPISANSVAFSAFAESSLVPACTTTSGTARVNCFEENQGSVVLSVLEKSSASQTTVTNSFTSNKSANWSGAGLELKPSGSTPPPSGSAPQISSFTSSPSSITSGQSSTLSWSVSGNPTPTLSVSNIGTVTGSSISVSPTQTTTYILTATNSQGSATSNTTVTVSAAPAPDTIPPSVPTNLSASAVSSSQINLSWSPSTDNTGVAGYRIYRNGTQVTTTSSTSYSDTGLSASTLYSYTVLAYDAAGNASAQSSAASATTQAQQTGARTFYIDFTSGSDTNSGTTKTAPWKRAPGMTGFSGSYSKQNGDTFVFKGGVTWTASFPWNLQGGGSGNRLTYTTDRSWYSGGSFSQPTFDRQSLGQLAAGASYITLNDLKFVNCGASQVANSLKCLQFDNTTEVTITNSTFATEAWISIFFVFSSSGTYSNFVWTGNDFSRTSGAIWFASAVANTQMRNITYNNNTFHDFSSQIGADVHGDGAWHGYVIPGGDSTQFMDNMQFCNNRFYGDFRRSFGTSGAMTAFFFHEGGLQNALICNNEMGFSPVQSNMFDGFIVLEGEGNTHSTGIQILNNSMANIGTNAMSAAIHISGGYNNVTVKNNIISGMQYPYYIEDPAGTGNTFVSDYNLLNGASGQVVWGSAFQSYATWRSGGRDLNSVLGSDPSWVSAPSNLNINSNSPAINKGTNLSGLGYSMLNSDKNNTSRGTSWDIGAFEYNGGTPPPPPPTPKKGDLNSDGLVNSIDLSLLVSRWNQNYPAYDLNGDNFVNSLDYAVMVQNWSV